MGVGEKSHERGFYGDLGGRGMGPIGDLGE